MADQQAKGSPMMSVGEFFDAYTKPMTGEEGSDMMPMLWYQGAEGAIIAVFADSLAPQVGGIQAMLAGMLAQARADKGPAEWVWFGCEAYAKTFAKREARSLRPGQLQEEAQAGSTEVREVIMLTGVGRGGDVVTGQRAFKREGGEVVWLDELEDHSVSVDRVIGGIPALLKRAVR